MRQEKDRELYSVFIKGIFEQDIATLYDAVDWARNQPASKFFLSSKALSNYIGAKLRGSEIPKMHSQNKRKMTLLYQRYQDYIATHPDTTLSRERICELLVDEPAPMFFIGHEGALRAILRERKRQRAEFLNKYKI